jgi:hypothetical protein
MHKRTQWMVCRSPSGAFLHVSPRLASIYMRIVDVTTQPRRESGSPRIGQLVKLGSSLGKDEYR